MSTIASRDLRNHTKAVLDRVAAGDVITITMHGEPVAEIRRTGERRSRSMKKADVLDLVHGQPEDATIEADLAWITAGTTDDLGPI